MAGKNGAANSSSEFGSLFRSPPVEVYTNDSTTPYYLHRENLCSKSTYFRQCLTSGFRESSSNQIRLRDSDYDTFSSSSPYRTSTVIQDAFPHFVDFIYTGTYRSDHHASMTMKHISQKPITDDAERRRLAKMLDEKAVTHAKVYVLADRFLVPGLRDVAVTKLQRCFDTSYMNSNPAYFVNPERVRMTVKISPAALVEVARLIYRNTYASTGSDNESLVQYLENDAVGEEGGRYRDPMRSMLAKYVASVITSVRGSEEVLRCFEELPEFMRDVFGFVADGPR